MIPELTNWGGMFGLEPGRVTRNNSWVVVTIEIVMLSGVVSALLVMLRFQTCPRVQVLEPLSPSVRW